MHDISRDIVVGMTCHCFQPCHLDVVSYQSLSSFLSVMSRIGQYAGWHVVQISRSDNMSWQHVIDFNDMWYLAKNDNISRSFKRFSDVISRRYLGPFQHVIGSISIVMMSSVPTGGNVGIVSSSSSRLGPAKTDIVHPWFWC